MKKILLTIAIALAVALAGLIIFLNIDNITGRVYSEGDITQKQEEGYLEGKTYKEYLDSLIKKIEEQIAEKPSYGETINEDALKELEELLKSQDASLVEVLKIKLNFLESQQGVYTSKASDLQLQLESINKSILELEELGSDAGQIAGFEYAKNYILTELNSYERLLESISGQITEVKAALAEAEAKHNE